MCVITCINNCETALNGRVKTVVLALIGGSLFGLGWSVFIDAAATYATHFQKYPTFHVPGITATLALILIVMVPSHSNSIYYDKKCALCARLTLLLGFVIAFSSLIGASFIYVHSYALHFKKKNQWPGVAILMQNIFIFISMILLKATYMMVNKLGF